MEIYRKIGKSKEPSSIALGFFDGVHTGHRAVIENALDFTGKKAVLTFSESPAKLLGGKTTGALISNEDKLSLFEKAGVDAVYMLDFSEIVNIEAKAFFKDILCGALGAKKLSCGYNYRFGKGGAGDVRLLSDLGRENGVDVSVAAEVFCKNESISSTKIRKLIENGEIALANKMLGRYFGFTNEVEHGKKLGSALGFPTVNQKYPEDFVLPKFGVYVSQTEADGKLYRSVTNIGVKPTVSSDRCLAETHIFGLNEDLYGKKLKLELVAFLREERKFNNLEELQKTVLGDCEKARNFII